MTVDEPTLPLLASDTIWATEQVLSFEAVYSGNHATSTEDLTSSHATHRAGLHTTPAALRLHPLCRVPGTTERVDLLYLSALRHDMAHVRDIGAQYTSAALPKEML